MPLNLIKQLFLSLFLVFLQLIHLFLPEGDFQPLRWNLGWIVLVFFLPEGIVVRSLTDLIFKLVDYIFEPDDLISKGTSGLFSDYSRIRPFFVDSAHDESFLPGWWIVLQLSSGAAAILRAIDAFLDVNIRFFGGWRLSDGFFPKIP